MSIGRDYGISISKKMQVDVRYAFVGATMMHVTQFMAKPYL
jgi:hypothetical protein